MKKDQERETIIIVGAAGEMGTRVSRCLTDTNHRLLFCEKSQTGIESIVKRGQSVTDMGGGRFLKATMS